MGSFSYSQTGNTQKIARAIRSGLRENGDEVTLRLLKNVSYRELENYDALGIGSPVWYEMPRNMRKFVEEMPDQKGKAGFSFCTHGTMPAHANAAIDHLGGFHNVHGSLIRDPQKCLWPKCHICMDNCTMNYIEYTVNPPKFGSEGNRCDDRHGCTYCEMLCPTGAIKPMVPYEENSPVRIDHGSELFCTVLEKAESEGKFRCLIPLPEVGIKTPYYSVHSRHLNIAGYFEPPVRPSRATVPVGFEP